MRSRHRRRPAGRPACPRRAGRRSAGLRRPSASRRDDLVGDRLVHDQPAQRGAALPGRCRPRRTRSPRTARSRSADGVTIARVVAAELEQRPAEARGDDGGDLLAHPHGAGRGDERHARSRRRGPRRPRARRAPAARCPPGTRPRRASGRAAPGRRDGRERRLLATASTPRCRRRPSATAVFHAQTATGKLNALMTPTTPSGCHVSISRWPGRSTASCGRRAGGDSPTAKSQMSIISWTSPRASLVILPASMVTSSARSALCSVEQLAEALDHVAAHGGGDGAPRGEGLGGPRRRRRWPPAAPSRRTWQTGPGR